MNDKKFVEVNRTGVFKRVNGNGSLVIPKEIRENSDIQPKSLIEIIPMREGFYVRKAAGKK